MEPKIKSKITIIYIGVLFFTMKPVLAETITFNPSESSVEFLAIGNPSALKIKGTKAKVQGDVTLKANVISAKLKVDLNEFETGIEMRDEHLKENYLETHKPENRFALIEIIDMTLPLDYLKSSKDFESPFKGQLTLRGVTKEIIGKISFTPYKKGSLVLTTSQFSIKLTNFNIEVPSFVGITVTEDVNIEVKLPLNIIEN